MLWYEESEAEIEEAAGGSIVFSVVLLYILFLILAMVIGVGK